MRKISSIERGKNAKNCKKKSDIREEKRWNDNLYDNSYTSKSFLTINAFKIKGTV